MMKKVFGHIWLYVLVLLALDLPAKEIWLTPENNKRVWATIQPGDKVVFVDGEYRSEFYLNGGKPWSATTPTIFVAQNAGKVIIKGSDVVQDWSKVEVGQYIKDWSKEPEQVFINGKPLTQLAGTIFSGFPTNLQSTYHNLHKENGGIWPGRINYERGMVMPKESFYFDTGLKKLIISTRQDLSKSLVEVSVRRRPFFAEKVNGIVLDGLVFEHANASYWDRGAALTLLGDNNIIRNVKVRFADSIGIQMVGDGNQLLDSTVVSSGQLGVAMSGARNTVKGVSAYANNARGFNKWWEAGGFKFVGNGGLQNSEVINNTAVGNQGDGIWFDWQNKHNLIKDNVVAYNTGFGIHYELSQYANIQGNQVYGNGQRGIFLRDSANCEVTNNLVIGNGLEGIAAVYTGQKDGKGVEFGADNAKVNTNTVGWNNGALIMPIGASKIGIAENNVYLGDQKSNKFSLGYPSALFRAVDSLKDWQLISGLDKKSSEGNYLIPKVIADALANHKLVEDWSNVNVLAEQAKNQPKVDFKSF